MGKTCGFLKRTVGYEYGTSGGVEVKGHGATKIVPGMCQDVAVDGALVQKSRTKVEELLSTSI